LVLVTDSHIKELIHKQENRTNRKNNKPSKTELFNQITNQDAEIIQGDPTAILSLNELPALLYEVLVNKKTGREIEDIIRKKIKEQFNIIKNTDTAKPLSKDLYPTNLSKAKKEVIIDYEKLKKDIQLEVDITNQKLKTLQENREEVKKRDKAKDADKSKCRKYVFFTSEKGKEATFLANDLKRFMPQKVKEEWKGFQHSELQRTLALYEHNKAEMLSLLSVWNFSADVIGESIEACFTKTTFEEFYEAYLNQRKSFLQLKLNQFLNEGNDPKVEKIIAKDCFKYFKKQNYTIQPLNVQINRLLAMPTNLPRGIFDSNPTRISGVSFETNKERFAKWFVYANNSEHQFQSFYNTSKYNRNYRDQYHENAIYNAQKELTPAKQFSNFEKRQEGEIRKLKVNDVFMKLIVNDLFHKIFNEQMTFSLKELFQTREERLQNQATAKQQKDRLKGDISENIKNVNYIWNKEVAIKLHEGSSTIENVKLKNVRKYKNYETDQRILEFIEYEPHLNWLVYLPSNWNTTYDTKPVNIYQIQIEEYEQIRKQELLKEIHLFEKEIYEAVADNTKLIYNGNPKFKKYVINGYLEQIKKVDQEYLKIFDVDLDKKEINDIEIYPLTIQQAYVLIMIRNKFAHNQLPNKNIYDLANKFIPKNHKQTYAKYFLEVIKKMILELKKQS
jgi:hypothetical protein